MTTVQQISGEQEIARIQGTKLSPLFIPTSTRLVLTNKRVYQETTEGFQGESAIIPLKNVDSFGLASSSKTWLLIIGVLVVLYGLYSIVTDHSTGMSLFIMIIGSVFIAAWWFTRKIGAIIHSASGKTELFVQASSQNMDEISNFIVRIQESLDEANSSLQK